MNRLTKVILITGLAIGLQGCKDLAKDLFGFEDSQNVDELVALTIEVTDSDTVQEQTDWSIRADVNLSFGDIQPEYQLNWQIIDAPSGFNMPLNVVSANNEGQTFVEFTTPDVDTDTEVTLRMTVSYNNGEDDEVITEDVDVFIEANEEVVISGAVVDEPIPNALVTVIIGDLVFETVADGNGNYTIELEFKDNNLVALITAVGTGDYSAVEFKSYLGDGESLQRAAGADGIISSDENDNVNVTNISTAEYVLIADVLEEGGEVTSQEQLDEITSQLDVNEVLEIAAVIKAVVDEGAELPEGTDTVLDLLLDKEATDDFVDDLLEENPDVINDLVQAIIDDPVLVPEDRGFDIAQKFFAVKLGDYQNLTSEVINLSDDVNESGEQEGTWSTFYGTFEVTWEKVDKSYVVDFADNSFIRTQCEQQADGITFCQDQFYKTAVIKKLPDTGDTSSIIVDYTYDWVSHDNSADVSSSNSSITFSLLTENDLIPFTAEELTSQEWVVRVLDESLDNSNFAEASLPFESVYTTFNEDGTGSYHQVLGDEVVNFTWEIQGINLPGFSFNFLFLDVAADQNNNSSDHSMVFSQVFNRKGVRQTSLLIDAQDFNKVNSNMANQLVSMNATMTPVNSDLDLETTPLIGRYALLERLTEEPNFYLQFNADGAGFQESLGEDESFITEFGWEETDKGLVSTYYTAMYDDPNTGEYKEERVASCDDYEEWQCSLSRERYFDVLDVQDDLYIARIFQIFYSQDESGNTYGSFYTSYIGIFERQNQELTNVTGEKILLWEDGQAAQKEAIKITLNADGTGSVHADSMSDLTWQQVNPQQIDITLINHGTSYTEIRYCEAINDDVTVTVTENTNMVTVLGASSAMMPDNRQGRWYVSSFGTEVATVEEDACKELEWDETYADTEMVNVFDAANLVSLDLTEGKYAFQHKDVGNIDARDQINSVALDLQASGDAINLLDDRSFTWSDSQGVSLFNGDIEYHYTHYFEMLGDAYYAVGYSIDEMGNNEFDAFLVVPFAEQVMQESDVVGSYADISNGYYPEVNWWLEFFDDNTGGMGDKYSTIGWIWSLGSNVTTLKGIDSDLQAIKANRYRYVFFDNDGDGEADDITQDQVINKDDIDYWLDTSMSDQGLATQKDCESGSLVCYLYNPRQYYIVNKSDGVSFWFRDSLWYEIDYDDYWHYSFGLFVFEDDSMSPLARSTEALRTGSRFNSHNSRANMVNKLEPVNSF